MAAHPNVTTVKAALAAHPEEVTNLLSSLIIMLGAKAEWSMDDNFFTTESVAALAGRVGLPSAGDQTDDGLAFYVDAARSLGLDHD